jgi:2-polyprenyl-6-methoxyphenol hydroxylase-like FAD-dependent oxidoreductase
VKVLISGAGIAGPALAYWLARYGLDPTLVERAPRLRTGGYIIDFWGAGFEIADRMGLLPEIDHEGYRVREVRVVNRDGRRVAAFPAEAFARATQGRYVLFGDSIARIDQTANCVHVTFERASARDFDLVIGADGLHSHVRELVFGPETRFEKYLGYKVAAFQVTGYRPRDELVYVMYTEVGQQVARFAMRDDRTMFLMTFADQSLDPDQAFDPGAQKALLRKRFGNSGWECPRILDALDASADLYFDRVSQIRMGPQAGSWSKGRVMLLGDAAFCVSLLAGQGSALAMVAAYILAGELHRAGDDYARAFARHHELFAPFVLEKQKAALRFAGTFAPKSKLSLFLRNQVMNLMRIPWVADLAVGRDLADRIALPEY